MVVDVLVILMAVVVLVVVIGARRRASTVQRSGRDDVLAALAPVVDGSVSPEQVLTGRYRGYDLEASLRTANPAPPDTPGPTNARADVEIVRLRLLGVRGGQPWSVWRAWTIPGMTWHFARSVGPVAGRLGRLAGVPQADPDLPDRLRAAGMIEAFERLGPPTDDSFPRIRFMPDLRPQMMERMRARGLEAPPSAREIPPDAGPWLEVEVERTGGTDPTPDRFREILDAILGIVEINARANPADVPSP